MACSKECPEKKITKEQLAQFMEMQKKTAKIQEAFVKDTTPIQKDFVKVLEELKKCKKCKDFEFKFVPCKEHMTKLKGLTEELQKLQFYYRLKQQLSGQLPQ